MLSHFSPPPHFINRPRRFTLSNERRDLELQEMVSLSVGCRPRERRRYTLERPANENAIPCTHETALELSLRLREMY
jgi:hypothetical protein